MLKKFKTFIQKNIHFFIVIMLIFILFNSYGGCSIKKEVLEIKKSNAIIISKIENTSGESLYGIVNNLVANYVKIDSLLLTIAKIDKKNTDMELLLNDLKITNNSLKVSINKIDRKIDELQANNQK